MKDKKEKLIKFIKKTGILFIDEIKVEDLIINEEIRKFCIQNKCGQYNKNFMCPPLIGSVKDFKQKIEKYHSCLIVCIKDKILSSKDKEYYYKKAEKLHLILLNIEKKAKILGFYKAISLIAGNCRICKPCKAALGFKSCPYPGKARPSAEALGVDVIQTLKNIGINVEFKNDEVTWIGMILI